MFLLDSLMIAGIRWALETTITAAEAEMNDDTVLREELLAAEMRREMGEISDAEFQTIEADLLARIREIKERREGGSGPIAFGAEPIEAGEDGRFEIEASVSGDFYDPHDRPHSTVVDDPPPHGVLAHLIETDTEQTTTVMDMAPSVDQQPSARPARRRPAPRRRKKPAATRRSRSKLRS